MIGTADLTDNLLLLCSDDIDDMLSAYNNNLPCCLVIHFFEILKLILKMSVCFWIMKFLEIEISKKQF